MHAVKCTVHHLAWAAGCKGHSKGSRNDKLTRNPLFCPSTLLVLFHPSSYCSFCSVVSKSDQGSSFLMSLDFVYKICRRTPTEANDNSPTLDERYPPGIFDIHQHGWWLGSWWFHGGWWFKVGFRCEPRWDSSEACAHISKLSCHPEHVISKKKN